MRNNPLRCPAQPSSGTTSNEPIRSLASRPERYRRKLRKWARLARPRPAAGRDQLRSRAVGFMQVSVMGTRTEAGGGKLPASPVKRDQGVGGVALKVYRGGAE